MNYSQKAIDLCKKYSNFSLKAVAGRNGILSIGYGHFTNEKHPIKPGMVITESQATQILRDDLNEHAALISKLLAIKATQNQFDALVSFSHSKGLGFLPSSDIMHFTNNKEFNSAAREIKLYVYDIGSIKLPKLVERRNAETALPKFQKLKSLDSLNFYLKTKRSETSKFLISLFLSAILGISFFCLNGIFFILYDTNYKYLRTKKIIQNN